MEQKMLEIMLETKRERGVYEAAAFARAMNLPIEQALRILVNGWQERQLKKRSLDFS